MSPQNYPVDLLAPVGSVGNIVGAAQAIEPDAEELNVLFVVEAIGATPTVTWKAQISPDGVNWFDAPYVNDASDAIAQAALTTAVVGATEIWIHVTQDRHPRFGSSPARTRTSTFRAELRQNDAE